VSFAGPAKPQEVGMYPGELQPGVFLRKSPFLVVKQLENHEVRVYSRLHGHLTSFDFDINEVLKLFDSRIDVETAARKAREICRCDSSVLIRELYEKRFLIEGNQNENDVLSEYVEAMRQKNRIPKVTNITFLVSAACNMACKACYHGFYDFKSSDMSSDFAGRILEGLFPYLKRRGIPALLISFLGYEPLLNFETLRRICDQAARMGEEYDIETSFKLYTNAFSVNEEIFEWIERNKTKLAIAASLDGTKEDNDKRRVDLTGKGTYDGVMKNLKRIVATGVECGVATVLSKLNFSNIERFVDEMAAVGIRTITANIFCGQSEDERLMELTDTEKFDAIRRMDLATEKYGMEFNGEWKFPVVQMVTGAQFFCPAGRKQMVFGADGAIYPCQRFAGTEINFGTYEQGFWEGLLDGRCETYNHWADDLYSSVSERTKEEKRDPTDCGCPFLPFLRGEGISKNLEGELNERLVEYYITRPLNRILTTSPMDCSH
jgi:uncharacterized protein